MLHRQKTELRSSDTIMELASLGAIWPTKFSFSHNFLRHVAKIGFHCEMAEKSLDHEGRGRIVYRANIAGEILTFVVFSNPLPEDQQQDRIIATQWDAWAALFIGIPSEEDLTTSRAEIQKVVWGRAAPGTITWSRANRSARLFDHVIARLAGGQQPDPAQLNQVGYLIRTTGFSGNGRNGMHDYAYLRSIGHPLQAPYHAQMLAGYLWREFGFDLALHLARVRNPDAADLSPDIRRFVGIGNSSGIGLVPFVVRHPRLLHNWLHVRERALAEFRDMTFGPDAPERRKWEELVERAESYFRYEPSGELEEFVSSARIAKDLNEMRPVFEEICKRWREASPSSKNPVAALIADVGKWATLETQELLNALALELHDDGAVDADVMHADESLSFPPDLTAGTLLQLVRDRFPWAERFAVEGTRPFFWYASEENMEPRRGSRGVDEGECYELPVDILGRLEELVAKLETARGDEPMGRFLVRNPDMRFMVGWTYTLADSSYSVARMDLLAADFSPLSIMRFQLAIYGMLKFRPRSKTWLRATLFQGAGLPEELAVGVIGDGLLPKMPDSASVALEDVIGE